MRSWPANFRRRPAAILATAGQSVGRHADHFCQRFAAISISAFKHALARKYGGFWQSMNEAFTRGSSFFYNVLFVVLIYFFCYFWTAITFNPKDMADNLKNFGTFVPGYRPGKRTADYLEKVMVRDYLRRLPFWRSSQLRPPSLARRLDIPMNVSSFFGGTGLLIAVSVAFDVVQKVDSHLVMPEITRACWNNP